MVFKLDNGLEVVLEENHAAPVVAFQAWVKIGSADEPPSGAQFTFPTYERRLREKFRS